MSSSGQIFGQLFKHELDSKREKWTRFLQTGVLQTSFYRVIYLAVRPQIAVIRRAVVELPLTGAYLDSTTLVIVARHQDPPNTALFCNCYKLQASIAMYNSQLNYGSYLVSYGETICPSAVRRGIFFPAPIRQHQSGTDTTGQKLNSEEFTSGSEGAEGFDRASILYQVGSVTNAVASTYPDLGEKLEVPGLPPAASSQYIPMSFLQGYDVKEGVWPVIGPTAQKLQPICSGTPANLPQNLEMVPVYFSCMKPIPFDLHAFRPEFGQSRFTCCPF